MPYVKIVNGPFVNDNGQIELTARVWHTETSFSAGDQPFRTNTFLFARVQATGSRIVTDAVDSHPLLDDGTRAPAYTAAEARQKVLDANPTLGVLQDLATGDAPTRAKVTALVEKAKTRYLGQPYLPTGRDWKREPVGTLDVAEIKDAIRRYYDRTVAAEGVGDALMRNDAAIGELAGQEFSV